VDCVHIVLVDSHRDDDQNRNTMIVDRNAIRDTNVQVQNVRRERADVDKVSE
jgi:hypothetical protein